MGKTKALKAEVVYNEFEEAALLGERFPDKTDDEVMEAVAEICGGDPTNPRSPVGIIMLIAYDAKSVKAAARASEAMFGLDFTSSR